jgi:hypothetical protein
MLDQLLWSYTGILFEHPGLAQSVLVTRPSGPAYLRLADGILALLAAGGVRPDQAAWAVDLLLHFATSTAAEQGTRERAIDANEEEDALAAVLRDASAETYPHIAALGVQQLMSGSGQDRLRWGFRRADHRDRADAPAIRQEDLVKPVDNGRALAGHPCDPV